MDRRYLNLVLVLILWLIYFVGHSYGARHSHQVFKVQPKGEAFPPSFFGFLPKAMPIPPSGPSRKHNGIGLQSSMGEPQRGWICISYIPSSPLNLLINFFKGNVHDALFICILICLYLFGFFWFTSLFSGYYFQDHFLDKQFQNELLKGYMQIIYYLLLLASSHIYVKDMYIWTSFSQLQTAL